MTNYSSFRLIQSGGLADVFLFEETMTCFKIFRRRGSEKREFLIAKYLMDRNNNAKSNSGILNYLDFGYISKHEVIDMYRSLRIVNPDIESKMKEIMFYFQDENEIPYVEMEYYDGIDALDFGLKNGYFNEDFAIDIMIQLLECIEKLHKIGLIHRDIKPDNFMICQDRSTGQYAVTLIDLGLAAKAGDIPIVEPNIGTKRYQSPEAMRGWHSLASDLYSAALSMYVLCGYQQDNSSIFANILLKLMDTDPSKRGSVSQAIAALKCIKHESVRNVIDESLSAEYYTASSSASSSSSTKSSNYSAMQNSFSSTSSIISNDKSTDFAKRKLVQYDDGTDCEYETESEMDADEKSITKRIKKDLAISIDKII